jgi:hypothetical protein
MKGGKIWRSKTERMSPSITNDNIIRSVQQIEDTIVERGKDAVNGRDIGNSARSTFPFGYGMKAPVKRESRNIKQLEFIEFWINLGEKAH